MRRVVPVVVIALLLVAPAVAGGSERLLEIASEDGAQVRMKAFDTPAAAVADFDGDGWVEIVAHNDNQYVYVMSVRDGRVVAEFRPDYPGNWDVRPINDIAVADVDGNGILEIISVTSAAHVCVHTFVPENSTRESFEFRKVWCHRMDDYDGWEAAADGGPWVEDVDGDGRMEIFAQTEDKGLYAFNYDGEVRWSKDEWGGNGGATVADLWGDGKPEVIFFDDGGGVRAYDASSGEHKWTFWGGSHVWPGSIPVAGSAADLDGDGKKEIVFMARHADHAEPENLWMNNFTLFVLHHDGRLKWKSQPHWGNPLSYTHPILYDVTGDGKLEIIAQDWNTMGHKPGTWQKTGLANVFAYRHDGAELWRTEVDNSWSNDDLGLADIDGDGRFEVFAIGYGPGGDGIWFLDAATGEKKGHATVGPGRQISRGPIIGDFDGSGKTMWAVPVHSPSTGGGWVVFRTEADCAVAFGGWQYADPCPGADAPLAKPRSASGGSRPPPPAFGENVHRWWTYMWADAQARADSIGGEERLAAAWVGLTLRGWPGRE